MLGRALLVKGLGFGAVDESLKNYRPVSDARKRPRRNRQIVTNEIKFRELGLLGEVRLVGMGDGDVASVNGQNLGGVISLLHKRQANTA